MAFDFGSEDGQKQISDYLITIAGRGKRDHNKKTLSSWGEIGESGKPPVSLNACL